MPTYSYQCKQCQAVQSIEHSMNENPKLACALCGGLVKRQLNTQINILKNKENKKKKADETEKKHVHTADCQHEHPTGSGCHWDKIDEIVKDIESQPDPERE